MNKSKSIGKKLSELIEEKGFKKEDGSINLLLFCNTLKENKIDIAYSTLHGYINSGNIPSKVHAQNLAIFFKVSPLYLMEPSITNRYADNLQIEDILGLSDKSIEIIKKSNSSIINELIENRYFSDLLSYLEEIQALREFEDKLLSIDTEFNVDKEYSKEAIKLLGKEILDIINSWEKRESLKSLLFEAQYIEDTTFKLQNVVKTGNKEYFYLALQNIIGIYRERVNVKRYYMNETIMRLLDTLLKTTSQKRNK